MTRCAFPIIVNVMDSSGHVPDSFGVNKLLAFWRGLDRNQRLSAVVLAALIVLFPLVLWSVKRQQDLRSRAAFPATPPVTPPVTPSPTATPTPSTDSFYNLSAIFASNVATFSFSYNGSASYYYVDLSTTMDMSWDVYLNFAEGTKSPIVQSSPAKWGKYVCGAKLTWRVRTSDGKQSPIQYTQVSCLQTPTPSPTFTNLSAILLANQATFQFTYPGVSYPFRVHLSTNSGMTYDVYMTFAQGTKSPIIEYNPKKWDKYSCGRTLYWRVQSDTGVQSSIYAATVVCPSPTPTRIATPSATPRLTPTPTVKPTTSPTPKPLPNRPPVIQTGWLPITRIMRSYRAVVQGMDPDTADVLTMTAQSLPRDLTLTGCGKTYSRTGTTYSCTITGVTRQYGFHRVTLRLSDNRGGSTQKTLWLIVY